MSNSVDDVSSGNGLKGSTRKKRSFMPEACVTVVARCPLPTLQKYEKCSSAVCVSGV